jgi:DNA-binding NarL/FixJ family response regulator
MVVRVLICDAASMTRTGLRRVLDDETGIEVVGEAGDGQEAVEAVRRLCPDVVLLDTAVERTEGLETTQQVRDPGVSSASPPGVIVLSNHDRDDTVIAAFRAGARGFLLKRDSADDLIYAVKKVADGGAILAPSVVCRLVGQLTQLHYPGNGDTTSLSVLTQREREVLRLLSSGLSNAEIARTLHVGEATVKSHVSRLLSKLGLRDRVQAAALAHHSGLVLRPGASSGASSSAASSSAACSSASGARVTPVPPVRPVAARYNGAA